MKKYTLCLFLALFLSACAKDSADDSKPFDPSNVKPYSTSFEKVDCDLIGNNLKIDDQTECGWFTAPESRYDVVNTNTVKLAVLTLKSSNENPEDDPIVYLHGGPGSRALDVVDRLAPIFENARNSRDIILVDQRGSGYSLPSLACPEVWEQKLNRLQIYSEDPTADIPGDTSLPDCRDRLQNDGVVLTNFTSIENASDINDLRKALSYDQWNVYGVSYGTRVAQTLMRYYPTGVRSVILDSAVPQNLSLLDISDTVQKHKLLEEILSGCANDTTCNSKYPDLKARFWQEVDDLSAEPLFLPIQEPDLNIDIETYPFTADMFIDFTSTMIDDNEIEEVPNKIFTYLEGNYSALETELTEAMIGELEDSSISYGAFFSIMCADEHINPYDPNLIDSADIPEIYKFLWLDIYFSIQYSCENWPHSKSRGLDPSPVKSDIPTLILAGKYDVRTTTDTAKTIEQYLTQATYAEFPNEGHGTLLNACSQDIRDVFYETPTVGLDTSCIAAIDPAPVFSKPGSASREKPRWNFPDPFGMFTF